MTKLLPIKRQKKVPTLREFDFIIQGISDEDSIEHLFIVDIEFDKKMQLIKLCCLTRSIRQFLKNKGSFAKRKFCFSTV